MKVSDVMVTGVPSIGLEDNIADAAQLMSKTGAGELVVMQGNDVVGIITERDMVKGCLVEGHISWKCNVYRHMTLQPISLSTEMHIGNAALLMIDGELELVPVTDDGKVVGLVSSNDIFHAVDRQDSLVAA